MLIIFKCLNQTVLMKDVGSLKFKQDNQSKASE